MKHKVQIDSFLGGTEPFWTDLEEHCVLGFCGLKALEVSDERILRASKKVNEKLLFEKFNNLIAYLEENQFKWVQSREILNVSREKEMLIGLLERIRTVLLGINKSQVI